MINPEEFDQEVFRLATKHIHFHTVQFLEKGGTYGYLPLGSGVLVSIDNRYLIFTASHVTEVADQKQLYINTPTGMVPVVGYVRDTDLKMDKHTDVAYIILEEQIGKALAKSYMFLPISMISHSHQMQEITQYTVMGYPEKNIRVEGKKVITGSDFFLLQGSKEKVFEYYGLSKDRHYVLGFAGKGLSLASGDKIKVNPEPYGISGCGLWFIIPQSKDGKLICTYRLIGIMTQFRKGKYHVLIGNRIELIMDALRYLEGLNVGWKM